MLVNSLSSAFSNSSSYGDRSGEQNPVRLAHRRKASTRLWSVAVVNPIHAGEAYINFATTTA